VDSSHRQRAGAQPSLEIVDWSRIGEKFRAVIEWSCLPLTAAGAADTRSA
jgi:hypothetical protein